MAHYLVTASSRGGLEELRARLDSGEIRGMRPFGRALEHSLSHARVAPNGEIVWEEEDYCRPPLAMEREAVLDLYFHSLEVEKVAEGGGWARIESLPPLWKDES